MGFLFVIGEFFNKVLKQHNFEGEFGTWMFKLIIQQGVWLQKNCDIVQK